MKESKKLLNWFSRTTLTIAKTLQLETAGGKALLAIEIYLFQFLALMVALFLSHDIIQFFLAWASGQNVTFHAFEVFIVSAILLVLSVAAVFIREMLSSYFKVL